MTLTKRLPLFALLISICLALPQLSRAETREAEAWRLIQQGELLIDVRTAEEYAAGHLPQALHIPYEQIVERFAQLGVRQDRPVVLYCRSGNRSGKAEKMLLDAGYSQPHNGGGYQALTKVSPESLAGSATTKR